MVPAFLCSLYLTFYKTDISLWRTTSAGPKGVRLKESQLYLSCLSAFFFFHLFSQGPFSTFHIQNDPNIEWTGVKFSSDGKMILLSASGDVIHLIDAFQGTQLHTFTVSKVKKAIIGFLAFISIIIFFVNDIWNKSCMNCGNEMKWKWSSQWTQFMQLRKEAWKKNSGLQQGLNPWTYDTSAMFYQLAYEATDVGSRSIGQSVSYVNWNFVLTLGYLMSDVWYQTPDIRRLT